jgi:hypothetical protein
MIRPEAVGYEARLVFPSLNSNSQRYACQSKQLCKLNSERSVATVGAGRRHRRRGRSGDECEEAPRRKRGKKVGWSVRMFLFKSRGRLILGEAVAFA